MNLFKHINGLIGNQSVLCEGFLGMENVPTNRFSDTFKNALLSTFKVKAVSDLRTQQVRRVGPARIAKIIANAATVGLEFVILISMPGGKGSVQNNIFVVTNIYNLARTVRDGVTKGSPKDTIYVLKSLRSGKELTADNYDVVGANTEEISVAISGSTSHRLVAYNITVATDLASQVPFHILDLDELFKGDIDDPTNVGDEELTVTNLDPTDESDDESNDESDEADDGSDDDFGKS